MAPPPGPVVLITGVSEGGIGASLAAWAARGGATVFGTVRRQEAAGGLAALGVTVLPLDVTQPAACAAAVDAVVAAAGRIDVLVNNAGIVTMGPTLEVPADLVAKSFETNVFGLLQMCQAAHRHMVAQGSGKIINIGSLTGLQPVPLRGVYSATKAAVQRLTDAMRIELAPFGVQVCYVAPGFINTKARENAKSTCAPTTGGLWGNWFSALERVTAARLAKAVPVDTYAAQLGGVIMRKTLPRVWVGQTAGLEWLPRFMPKFLQDRVLSKALGIAALEPEMKLNAAVLAAKRAEQQQGGGGGGGSGGKKQE